MSNEDLIKPLQAALDAAIEERNTIHTQIGELQNKRDALDNRKKQLQSAIDALNGKQTQKENLEDAMRRFNEDMRKKTVPKITGPWDNDKQIPQWPRTMEEFQDQFGTKMSLSQLSDEDAFYCEDLALMA